MRALIRERIDQVKRERLARSGMPAWMDAEAPTRQRMFRELERAKRCQALTADYDQCRFRPRPGSDFCGIHQFHAARKTQLPGAG